MREKKNSTQTAGNSALSGQPSNSEQERTLEPWQVDLLYGKQEENAAEVEEEHNIILGRSRQEIVQQTVDEKSTWNEIEDPRYYSEFRESNSA